MAQGRDGLIEFRVTFGWNQPHGPSPEAPHGKYTTVWAPDIITASDLAMVRYSGKWANIYFPVIWENWGDSMKGAMELEVLQYDPERTIQPFPHSGKRKATDERGVIYGKSDRGLGQ